MARFFIRVIVPSGPVTNEFVIIIIESANSIFLEKQELVRKFNCKKETATFTNYTRDTRVDLRYDKHPA